MNDTPRPELLPAPEVPDLPDDRHRELKDAFMQTITEVRPQPARRRWPMIAVPVAAATMAIALITVVAVNRPTDRGPEETVAAPIVAIDPGNAKEARAMFDRLALAAGARPATSVGSGQFVYVRSKVAWLVFAEPFDESDGSQSAGEDPQKLDKVHSREIWLPATAGSKGLIRERGETFGLEGARTNSSYAEMPTEPGALLRKIYAETKGQGDDPDDVAFDYIGEALRESILPPSLAAALYRTAAEIPGVVLVKDSVDAAGRHGVAVGRTDTLGERTEWIFDPQSYEYLGERSYLVRDTKVGKAGMLTATTAVLERAVVNKPGAEPQ
ncbi:CU044_5270 family protein [Actinoplanes sp. NPDC051470]|uniref:CU044_5270 family protein n=1 Tax=Actinoplanes sp. NPDC051470 TaxID=3157224 RepID=UPI003424A9E1